MSQHKVEQLINGPFEADAATLIAEFCEANGYKRRADAGEEALVFERGEEGAGWWTSAMTGLLTQLEVQIEAQRVRLRYTIDIAGQRLSDEDRKFWAREAEHMGGYLRGGTLFDLRHAEEQRAARTRSGTINIAMVGGFGVFCLIIALHFLDII